MNNIQPLADAEAIRADLVLMTRHWHELPQPAQFEVRAFKEGAQPKSAKFRPEWIEDAVSWIADMNRLGHNTYAVRNPIRYPLSGSATDADILAARYLWADCDDPAAAANVLRFDGPKWTAAIQTGSIPHRRAHVYWELDAWCFDLDAWRAMQTDISQHFASDPSVVNPSRIMRVAGTVTWPAAHKRAKGYESEVTTIRTDYPDARHPVTLEQMRRVFGERTPARPAASAAFEIATAPAPLDRERLAIQALAGQEWHNAVIRLVASYVAKGLSDSEIHALTAPLTLAGYTPAQTAAEVQTAIDGARRKGWTPPPPLPPAPVPKSDDGFEGPDTGAAVATALEWFDDVEPALADSYLIKGVLAAGAMSVIYGPSNSGKTFFALDLAYHIAAGMPWRGLRVTAAGVLYLAAEGGRGVANRIAALKEANGILGIPLALRRAGMDLLRDGADLQAVCDLAREVATRAPGAPLMIVVDTLSRVMAGGDENSAADMTALIRNIDAIRHVTQAHIMLVHHTGKDAARGARGHSSLRAATDTEIEVQSEDGNRAAIITKQRDYQGGETFAFTLKTVQLGHDQDGDEVSSCVVEPVESEEFKAAQAQKKGMGGNQKLLLETFDQMLSEGMGKPNPGGVGLPDPGRFWTVRMDDFRSVCMGKMAVQNKRSAFLDAWRSVSDSRGVMCSASDLVWRTDRKVMK